MLFNQGKYSTIIGRCYAPHRLVVGLLHLGLLVLPSEPLSEWLSEGLSPTPNHALIFPQLHTGIELSGANTTSVSPRLASRLRRLLGERHIPPRTLPICLHRERGECTRVYTFVYLRVHKSIHTCTQLRSRRIPQRGHIIPLWKLISLAEGEGYRGEIAYQA